MSDQLEYLRSERGALKERAQGWEQSRRLRKVQEECAELIAAINRYIENPSAYRLNELAEEFVGVDITIDNVRDAFVVETESVTPRQLLRLKAALDRDGL